VKCIAILGMIVEVRIYRMENDLLGNDMDIMVFADFDIEYEKIFYGT
jgi:hypothetical protein